jgi:hypothetical protein
MDVFLPAYQELHSGPKFATRLKQWSQTIALPEDAMTYLMEVVKFLGIAALIMVGAFIMLMTG